MCRAVSRLKPPSGRGARFLRCVAVTLALTVTGACAADARPVSAPEPTYSLVLPTSSPQVLTYGPAPSSAAGGCSAPGVRVSVGRISAAMGLRAVGLMLTNCGSEPYTVNGFPRIRLLDAERQPVDLAVLHGAPGGVPEPGPSPITLRHGGTVESVLSWRNTAKLSGRVVTAAYVAVTPPGGQTQVVPLRVDTGTTGHVQVNAWHIDQAEGDGQPSR